MEQRNNIDIQCCNSIPDLSPRGQESNASAAAVAGAPFSRSIAFTNVGTEPWRSAAGIRTVRGSRVTWSTMTASLALVHDEQSASVRPVVSGVKRMLIIVCTVIGAFFFRASVILYCLVSTDKHLFPRRLWLPYLAVSEILPYALLLLFYFTPGVQAIYIGRRRCFCGRQGSSSISIGDNQGTPRI